MNRLVDQVQRVPANKKLLANVFKQWPIVLSIVLYENRDLFLIQGGFLFARARCMVKFRERPRHRSGKSAFITLR